ncbi:hypothetical protein [Psychroserpens sp.]
MKNFITSIFMVFLFFISLSIKAQELPNIIPPSPEAASLMKHSQMEVSLYTGTPNISIPFYTIAHKNVNIPIGITYNSGGVKVEDIASWVGLGWNLNAGGLVSRSIKSLPDDAVDGHMNTSFTLIHFGTRHTHADENNPYSDSKEYHLSAEKATQRDYEPDEFNYSFPGYSGRFFYDQSLNEFIQTPYSNIIIETKLTAQNQIEGFVITTPNGIKYHFGKSIYNQRKGLEKLNGAKTVTQINGSVFYSDPQVFGSPANPYYQSWMLMDIEFPTSSEIISFTYTDEPNVKTNVLQKEEFVTSVNCPDDEYRIIFLNKLFSQPKLSQIEFPQGVVKFEKSTGTNYRDDLKNSFPLKNIKLYNNDLELIKGIELHTSYFMSPAIVNSSPQNINSFFDLDQEGDKRLRLDSISQFNANLNKLERHHFEYNSLILPDRYSRSQDYFGFYNGKKKNTTLVPKSPGIGSPNANANRAVDTSYTKACVLEKITYPTGGFDKFTWENNTVSTYINGSSTYRDYLLDEGFQLDASSGLFTDPDPNVAFSKEFTISANSDGVVIFKTNFMDGPQCTGTSLANINCAYILNVLNSNNVVVLNILERDITYTFSPGDYKIVAIPRDTSTTYCDLITDQSCNNPAPNFSITLGWTVDPTPNEYMFGGLRIKEINTYKDVNDLALSREFDYTKFSDNLTSSGWTFKLPTLQMGGYRACMIDLYTIGTETLITSNVPMELTKGGYVGYENVTERYVNSINEDNGRKEYTFPFRLPFIDSPLVLTINGMYPSVFKTSIYTDWKNGNLELTEFFDKSGSRVKSQINEYESVNSVFRYQGIEVYRMPEIDAANPAAYFNNSNASYYLYTSEWHRLKNSITTSYNDIENLIERIDYTYNNNPLLASQTKVTTSDSKPIINKVFYPNDVTSNSSLGFDNLSVLELEAIQKLQTPSIANLNGQHRISTPIQTEVYKDLNNNGVAETGELLNVNRTNYMRVPTSGFREPEIVQTGKGANPTLKDRIQFHDYDNYGNPLEVSKADGTHIMYIWGYDNTVPIAKIEGYSYDSVSNNLQILINTIIVASDNDINNATEETLRLSLNSLRNHIDLSSSMVNTFTYDPLIGITSMTDQRGYTIYYEYDDFNRLLYVKDKDGNILSENEYNYKNQY